MRTAEKGITPHLSQPPCSILFLSARFRSLLQTFFSRTNPISASVASLIPYYRTIYHYSLVHMHSENKPNQSQSPRPVMPAELVTPKLWQRLNPVSGRSCKQFFFRTKPILGTGILLTRCFHLIYHYSSAIIHLKSNRSCPQTAAFVQCKPQSRFGYKETQLRRIRPCEGENG